MSLHRQAARRDDNESEIVTGLRAVGCDVVYLNYPADLLCGHAGLNHLLEIKDPAKPPSARKLTGAEAEFHRTWRGQVAVVHDLEGALAVVGLRR